MAESKYARGQNPRSLRNLGKPKTKAGKKLLSLTQESLDWLASQKNASKSVDQLIDQQQKEGRRMSQLPYEVINDNLSVYPDIAEYERVNGVTHYDFRVSLGRNNCWQVKARPYQDWEKRLDAAMNESG